MENIFDNKWDRSVNYTGNPNVTRDSSGSRWQDALIGFGSILGETSRSNRPEFFYVDSNYAGNGLARSSGRDGIGSIKNNRYKDPLLMSEFLKSDLRQGKYGYGPQSYSNDRMSSQLADIFAKKILGNIGSKDFINANYPTSIYDNSWYSNDNSIYNYTTPQINLMDYLGDGKYADFGKKASDYLGGI